VETFARKRTVRQVNEWNAILAISAQRNILSKV
jgi:hypothetical protein